MLIIQGPFPQLSTALILPSPEETNTQQLTSTVQTKRMMDGSLRTHVKRRNGRKKYRWEFVVGNAKAKEVEDYFIANAGRKAQAIWQDVVYIGYLTLNPFEMGGQVAEYYRITIEFEERP